MEGPSVERNLSNALDVLNGSAREATIRLDNILNVVVGPRPEKAPDAKPCTGGLFSDLECLAFSLQKTQDQLAQLERAIGHGGKNAMPPQPLGASGIGGQACRPY